MDARDGYLCGVEGLNMWACKRAAVVVRPICTYVAVPCDHMELFLTPPPQPGALCDDSEALATGAAVGAIEVCPMCSDGHFPAARREYLSSYKARSVVSPDLLSAILKFSLVSHGCSLRWAG